MNNKIKLTLLLLLLCILAIAQVNQYKFRRELHGIKNQWHKIILPNEIFSKVSADLPDLRIYGITKNNDTIEAPYILQVATEKADEKEVACKLINQSKNDKGYYYTFKLPAEIDASQINLHFKQQNFDWRVSVEGSQDQLDWFSIVENYRILSIKNELTSFTFNRVVFPRSTYRYLRLHVSSKQKPELETASISLDETIDGNFRKYSIQPLKTDEDKKNKQTIIDINLETLVPVSYLKFYVKEKFDYYRPVKILYPADSIKTLQGWNYYYKTLSSGTLNSIEENKFGSNSTIVKQIRVVIENQDNAPLHIDSVEVKGYVHELVARFTEPATYYLTYGNKSAEKPQYDIERFKDKIPATLLELQLGDEQLFNKAPQEKIVPLFLNKKWLWSVMAIIIVLLGWFSLKMIREKSQ
jgi:hypothetical protein